MSGERDHLCAFLRPSRTDNRDSVVGAQTSLRWASGASRGSQQCRLVEDGTLNKTEEVFERGFNTTPFFFINGSPF